MACGGQGDRKAAPDRSASMMRRKRCLPTRMWVGAHGHAPLLFCVHDAKKGMCSDAKHLSAANLDLRFFYALRVYDANRMLPWREPRVDTEELNGPLPDLPSRV